MNFEWLMPHSTGFQLQGGDHFYWWKKVEATKKTTDLSLTKFIITFRVHFTTDRNHTHNYSGDKVRIRVFNTTFKSLPNL